MKLLAIATVCFAYLFAECKGDPIDCSTVFCALFLPVCEDGATPIKIPNSGCCPEYRCPKPDHCSNTACLIAIDCLPGYEPHVRPNSCCPDSCKVSKCSGVVCPLIKCPGGYTTRRIPGQCCPVCVKDNTKLTSCAGVLCLQPVCEEGYSAKTLPQQCCPVCRRDKEPNCFDVICPLIVCADGFEPIVPEGDCCQKCLPTIK